MSGQLILGKDVANNNYVPISVDSSGHLDIDVQVADLDSKCMGSETGATDGTQHQLRVDNTGALHIVSENYDSVLIKGVDTGAPGVQRDCKQNSNGDLRSALVGNTAKDGTGTNYYVVVDSDGKLESTAGDATAANQTTQIANQGTINTSIGTVNTSIGTSNSTLTDIEAHQGNIENNLSSIQSTVSANKLQVDVITSALPSGAATETTLAAAEVHLGAIDTSCSSIQSNVSTSSNQGTMITSLASLAGCVSGTELQVDIVSGGGGGGGDASAANQTTMITHLSEIEGAVETIETCVSGTELQVDVITSALPTGAATEATLAAAEAHLGTIDTSTASVAGCVSGTELQVDIVGNSDTTKATSTLQTAGNATLVNCENNLSSIQSTVSSNRLQVNTNNATHGTLAQLSVASGATGVNSAILNTAGYSKLVLIVKNSTNTSSSITASLLWSDSATFTGGTDLVMSSEDLSGGAFGPISFSLSTSADGITYGKPQGLFSLSPPAQYCRVNVFQSTGSTLDMDFFYILSR